MKRWLSTIRTLFAAALLATLLSCGDRATKAPVIQNANAQVTDTQLVRRATYLRAIQDLSAWRPAPKVFFLSLQPGEERDIDTVYKGLNVRPSSECVVDQKGVRAGTSGEEGVGLEVKRLEIIGTSAEADILFYYGAAEMYTLRLQKKDGAWTVTEKKMLWVT